MNPFLAAKADTQNSTFRHVINYADAAVVGYSKKLGFPEKANKHELLADSIGRLLWPSLDRGAIFLDFFQRQWKTDGGQYAEKKIVSIYEDGWEFYQSYKADTFLQRYLEILFQTRNHKMAMVQSGLADSKNLVFKGTTFEELREQCNLMALYHPRDRVQRLFDAICRKYNWGYDGTEKAGYARQGPAAVAETSAPVVADPGRGQDAVSIGDVLANLRISQ